MLHVCTGISEITAFCTSGSVCGVDVTTKGSFPVDGVLNIRAFKEFCGYESAAALELPDGGRACNCARNR